MGAAGSSTQKSRRLVRTVQWIAVAVGGVIALAITLAIIAAVVKVRRTDASVERALREVADQGDPTTRGQLARPPIPDDENAAILYAQAFEALDVSEEDETLLMDVVRSEKNLADSDTASAAEDILARNAEALRLIRLASAMPQHDFGLEWNRGLDMTFPHLSGLRNCARLLAFEGAVLAGKGRGDEAAVACGHIFGVADAADEPIVICQLVRWAICGIGLRALETALNECQASSEVCLRLAAELGRTEIEPSLVDALKGERAMGIALFDEVRTAPDPLKAIQSLASDGETDEDDSDEGTPREVAPRANPVVKWWLASDEAEYLRLMARAIEIASQPYRELSDVLPTLEMPLTGFPSAPALLTSIIAPSFDRTFALRDQAISHIGLGELLLLLEAHEDALGGHPDSLDHLAEFAGRELPVDPFSGQPFSYRRGDDGFVLYSWGSNLVDDGGTPPPPDHRYEGDIVVRCGG
jgi:hypothetical protein